LCNHILKARNLVLSLGNLFVEVVDFFLVESCLGGIGPQRLFTIKGLLFDCAFKLGLAVSVPANLILFAVLERVKSKIKTQFTFF
jgi:hypothetical protein